MRSNPNLYSPNALRLVPSELDQTFDIERVNAEQWKSEFYREIH
jgi:hypothetical protein